MGSIYRRTEHHCNDCNRRLARTADRKECEAAGHVVEKRESTVWWIQYYRDGKRHNESTESKRLKDAQSLLKRREGDIERGLPVSPRMDRLTFDDAMKAVTNDYVNNELKTLEDVERRIELHLKPVFGGKRMIEITADSVAAFAASRKTAGASNAEINRELAILIRAFTLAVDRGKLYYRPKIKKLKENNRRIGFFERAQFESVRVNLPAPLRPVATFAYITGWRAKSEILPLEWRQVDFEAGEVRLDDSKNGEGRVFVMTADLRRVLQEQKAEHDRLKAKGTICPFVFHRNGKRIKYYDGAWETATTLAGCPGRIVHDFRRTAVRNLVRAGVSEQIAMRMTGHKTRSVFDRYDIVSGNDLREAAAKLDAATTATKPLRSVARRGRR